MHSEERHHEHRLELDLLEMQRRLSRRRVTFGAIGAFGALTGLGILSTSGQVLAQAGTTALGCSVVPSETAGPFPANGSGRWVGNAPNALALSGIVRSDIRSSMAGAQGLAQGVPLELTLDFVNAGAACGPAVGVAVYLWQCDREGRYSLYSPGVVEQNYLRGVQVADAAGRVRFTTVFPGCYPGRMPHLHFEVYRSLGASSSAAGRLKTSQLAFAPALCEQIYAQAPGYGDSASSLRGVSFETDGIFRDGVAQQLLSAQGSLASGLRAALVIGISA